MSQVELTKRVFARSWSEVIGRSEQFLAISAPAIFVLILLGYLLSQMTAQLSASGYLASQPHLRLYLAAAYLVRYLEWLVAFLAFGALAAMAEGARTVGASFQRVRGVFGRLVGLSLLIAPAFLVTGLASSLPALLPRMAPVVPKWLASPWILYPWTWLLFTVFALLLFGVPALIDHPVSSLDALVEGVRASLGTFIPRAAIVGAFEIALMILVPLAYLWLGRSLQHSENIRTVLLIYGLFSTFIAKLVEFAGLYAICVMYRELRQQRAVMG